MAFWGLSWSNAKILGDYFPPLIIMFWRFFIASIVLFPFLFHFKFTIKKLFNNIIELLGVSILLIAYNYCYFKGTYVGFAGIGGVIVTTLVPTITTILSSYIYKKVYPLNIKWGIFSGCVSGIILMNLWEFNFGFIIKSGNIYFIIGAILWSLLTLWTQRITTNLHILHFSYFLFLLSSILIFVINPQSMDVTIFSTDTRFWLNFISVTVGALAFGTVAFFYATQKLGAQSASSFTFLVPVSALFFSYLLLNEIPTILTFIGCALAIFSVYLINKPSEYI
jgi:drug/metabolite transporter (DMT)-like permease